MDSFGLYVHIPFCLKKCDYCDFFSRVSSSVPDLYVEALLKELEYRVKRHSVKSFRTIYIGGGTPSLLSPLQIKKLFDGIKFYCKSESPIEVTYEMNPETITEEKLKVLDECGVTRISLGVQSLNDRALKAVGRHCTRNACLLGLSKLKSFWKKDFNLDAIAGLPGQSTQEFLSSLNEIIAFNPSHISMYTLTVEEGTPLYEKIQQGFEVDGDLSDVQWLKGKEVLRENGYFEYEVSNFSKKGKESQHNMLYWQQKNYIGIGSGGCGTVYSNADCFTGLRWTGTENIEEYVNFWTQACDFSSELNFPQEAEALDEETLEFEFLMMGLRTLKGVSEREYALRFSHCEPWYGNLSKRLGVEKTKSLWSKFLSEGKARCYSDSKDGRFYALTEEGLLFLNSLLLEL